MSREKYTLIYEDSLTGNKVTREFYADYLWELAHNILEFVRSTGFDNVCDLAFSDDEGGYFGSEFN